jgi:hypothetical protein
MAYILKLFIKSTFLQPNPILKPSIFVEIDIPLGMHDKLSSKGKRGLKSLEYGLVFCEEREGENGQICV